MLYIPKIGDYLKTLTDDELKDFIIKNFGGKFTSMKEKLYSIWNEEHNLRKVADSLYLLLSENCWMTESF